MPTYATDDIVVFLPGITGSVLQKDGRDVWGTSAGAIFRVLKSGGESIRHLALDTIDDPSLDDLGDGVVATRLVPDTHIVPGLWKIDGYTKMMRDISDAFGLESGTTAFEFPYDWRRDNRASARKLQRSVEFWLHARRKDRPKAKVVLVAHSMGGLVSRYYLEVLGGWEHVRMLVTFGTPYGGSVKSLNFIANGHRPGIGPARLDMSSLLRSFTSVYQLLPTYECMDAGAGTLRMIGEVPGMPNFDYSRVASALAFHDEIAAAVRARASAEPPHIVPVVGIEQPTVQSARFKGGVVEILDTIDGRSESGDGTVPRASAVPFELATAAREVYASEAHGSLQNHDGVLAHLRGVMSRPDVQTKRVRPGGPVTLSLSLPDYFDASQNIELSVQPSEGQPALVATLSTTDGREVAQTALRPRRDGTQRAAFDAPPEGIYRMRVSGSNGDSNQVAPVTDVFVVAGADA